MIKIIRKRFILYATMIISVIVVITLSFGLHRNNTESFVQRYIVFGLFLIIAVLIGSVLLSNIAVKPIQQAWQQQLNFTADASHELRTPLSVIQSNLELVMEDKNATVAEQEKWLKNIENESHRMNELVEALLTLSRADTGANPPIMEDLPLAVLVRIKTEGFEALANAKGIAFRVEIPEDLILHADRGKIERLLTILIDNAVKYMGRPGEICIKAAPIKKEIRIEVRDNGVGIASKDLPYIFNRFYRADQSRDAASKGAGLGLAIAQMIAAEHKGTIKVTSEEGVGTEFVVELPVYPI